MAVMIMNHGWRHQQPNTPSHVPPHQSRPNTGTTPTPTRVQHPTRLSKTEYHFISHVLAFFVAFTGIISKNLSSNFATEVTAPKAQCFHGFQIAVKNIHSIMYSSLLFDMYIKDPMEKLHLLHTIKQYHAFNAKPTGLSNGATPPTPVLPNK